MIFLEEIFRVGLAHLALMGEQPLSDINVILFTAFSLLGMQ